MKIIEALISGAERLAKAGIENSRFDADLIMGKVLNLQRDKLYLERERELTLEEEVLFNQFISRRESREPLQYILGFAEFMGLKLKIDKRVLIPRADTETLVEVWLELTKDLDRSKLSVLDLCTGSGAIALAIGHFSPQTKIAAADISEESLAVARENSERLKIEIDFYQGDFLQAVEGKRFDYIITNPPYVSVREYGETDPEIKFEPPRAFLGGEDGLDFYRRLANEGRHYLKEGGQILMEIGWNQGQAVERLFQKAGYVTKVFPDLAGRDRVVWAR